MRPTLLQWLVHSEGETGGLAWVTLVLGYLGVMSFVGMFALKVSHYYGLYRGSSDGASLMFATINFSRVSAPLVLHFLEMLGLQQSVYITIMGQATQLWLVKVMPVLLLLLMAAYHFSVWQRLLVALGMDSWGFDQDD
jgi:hypothetical protein